MGKLSKKRAAYLLSYDPTTGIFHWRDTALVKLRGEIAGTLVRNRGGGHIYIQIDGTLYPAHQIAWLLMTGKWPRQLDHADGCGTNNRFANLRPASHAQNLMNRGANKNNSSGYKGVTWNKHANKWAAQIMVNRANIYLGIFSDKDDAARAYNEAAVIHHGEFARLNDLPGTRSV